MFYEDSIKNMNKPDNLHAYRRIRERNRSISLVFLQRAIPSTPSVVKTSAYKARMAQHIREGGTRQSFIREEALKAIPYLNRKGSLPQLRS